LSELETAIRAIKEAGRIVRKYYGKTAVTYKSDKSLVTEADSASEKIMKNILQKEFPDYPILSEETGLTGEESDYLWVVDPLDGTTNYAFQNPFYDISIALTHKGNPILGIVLYPPQNELFWAEKGKGAYLNKERITVSDTEKVDRAIVTFCHNSDQDSVRRMINAFSELKVKNNNVRQLGAPALDLCYVACGRVDGFYMIGMHPWDVAAGAIILREAGGRVTDFSDHNFDLSSSDILGSNGRMHDDLLNILQNI
jgi:myo-inositol-1(or 4)-monophosphatase